MAVMNGYVIRLPSAHAWLADYAALCSAPQNAQRFATAHEAELYLGQFPNLGCECEIWSYRLALEWLNTRPVRPVPPHRDTRSYRAALDLLNTRSRRR